MENFTGLDREVDDYVVGIRGPIFEGLWLWTTYYRHNFENKKTLQAQPKFDTLVIVTTNNKDRRNLRSMLAMHQIHRIREGYFSRHLSITGIAKAEGVDWKTAKKYIAMEDFKLVRVWRKTRCDQVRHGALIHKYVIPHLHPYARGELRR